MYAWQRITCWAVLVLSLVAAKEGSAGRLPMPDPAGDKEAFLNWQQRARERLSAMLGIPLHEAPDAPGLPDHGVFASGLRAGLVRFDDEAERFSRC